MTGHKNQGARSATAALRSARARNVTAVRFLAGVEHHRSRRQTILLEQRVTDSRAHVATTIKVLALDDPVRQILLSEVSLARVFAMRR